MAESGYSGSQPPMAGNTLILKFQGRYKKMPPGIEYLQTYITDVGIIDKRDIPPAELEADTARTDGTHFQLWEAKLIWVKLWTDALPNPVIWITHRLYSQERFEELNAARGQQVRIQIL